MGAHPGFGSSGGGDSMENDGKMCDEVNKGEPKLILNGSYDTPIKVSQTKLMLLLLQLLYTRFNLLI
jgi:hypothetical protein